MIWKYVVVLSNFEFRKLTLFNYDTSNIQFLSSQVIPLIQTFGHLEFVLKTEEFLELREVPRYPQVLCPSNNKSIELIKTMIDQVLSLHHDVKYLHIGSDEVYFIGKKCKMYFSF